MRSGRAVAWMLALLVLASAAAQGNSEALTSNGDSDWQGSELVAAQALAEEVLDAEWNRDKITRIEPSSTTLRMTMTTLVDRTTGIEGFATGLAAQESSLDDRLSGLGAEITETEVTIRLPGALLFDFDSFAIRADAERILLELAAVLNAYSERPVRVEGHTDSIASDAYNQKLSEQRAGSIRDWLTGHGIEPSRLQTVGHGESRPVADNGTAAGRQLNRRVEVIIEKGGGPGN